jgi:ATP-dependent Zn protease
MKASRSDFIADRFTVIDKIDKEGVIAVREKASVQVDKQRREVKMHDFSYTFDEIVAVADRLKAMMPEEEMPIFS